jgi:ATP-dependent Clp protease ATP-binding subunit ClpC
MSEEEKQSMTSHPVAEAPRPTKGVVIGEKTYVWSEHIDSGAIALKAVRDGVAKAVNITAFGLAVGCFLALAVSVFIFQDITAVTTRAFWITPSFAGLWFSLWLLFSAFSFYRFSESVRKKAVIPVREHGAALPEIQDISEGSQKNIAKVFHVDAMKAVEEAYDLALRYKHQDVMPLHLFVGSLASQDAAVVFGRLGLTFDAIKEPLKRRLLAQPMGEPTALGSAAEEALLAAFVNAYAQGRETVSALEVFYEAYKHDAFLQELFYDQNVDEKKLANVVEWIRISGKMRERYEQFRKAAAFKPTGAMNRSMTSVVTPTLDAISEDLTSAAVSGHLPMLIGREQEMEEIMRVIEGGRQSVVLVGPEGVGKTSILGGIAQLMVEERVPKILQDKRLVSLNIPALVSGATPSQAQERLMRALVDVVKARNIVLAIPNIEQMTGLSAGGEQTADLSSVLVDFLQRGSTFAIATTSPQSYTASVERSILGRVFQKVNVLEPDTTTAIHVLESRVGGMEYEQKVVFSYDAIEKAVELTDRYMHERYLPKKAIEVAREVALQVSKTKGENGLVTGDDVSAIVSSKTNIPVTEVGQDEKTKLLGLEEKMHGRVIGQDEAVKSVAAAIRRARAELRAEDRPIANFLFLGPTGVGKTELAKTVAETYFGSETAMLRFDMSEYQEKSSITRLIGEPGSNDGGLMSEAVRQNPFSIVLLDELEKAHPEILNVFLQVFDDGRLTDAAGRTIDFTNTIIIATSNAGSSYIQDAINQNTPLEQIKTHLMEEELRTQYRPEFLNRFDAVIVFKPLTQDEVSQIAYLMIAKVAKRLEPKGINFRATDEAVMELARKGYDPQFGARPLRRVVQEEVDNAIADALLEGKASRRDTIVLNPGGEITVEKAEAL